MSSDRLSKLERQKILCGIALLLVVFTVPHGRADLAMETETARLLEPGQFQIGTAFEFQTSRDGREYAMPMALEVGVFQRVELLIEPVAVTSIRPKGGESATDIGDLEVTVTGLVIKEQKFIPAVALAGEVKFPTSGNRQIGSGEFDYRLYAVASKRLGDFDVHVNLGYNIVGPPPGVETKNPIDVEAGVEWFVHPRFDLFAEINYIGSSIGSGKGEGGKVTPDETTDGGAGTPEISAAETIGTIGTRFHASRNVDIFGSFSYDNNDAKLFRTGITFKY